MGKVLKVNLSEGSVKEEKTNIEIAKKYLGGKGLRGSTFIRLPS